MELKVNSSIISLLRFPLIVGVVLCHSLTRSMGAFPSFDFVCEVVIDILTEVCVSLFFFFSGYLFFIKIKNLSFKVYLEKIRRRVFSLLIPYVFWNLFCIALFGIGVLILPTVFDVAFKELSDLDLSGWFSLFYFALDTNQPIAYHLWFLRDLMLITLFTPVIYYLCRWLKFWWIIPPFVAYLLFIPLFGKFSYMGIAFFCAGSYYGLNKCSFRIGSKRTQLMIIIFYVIMLFVLSMNRDSLVISYIFRLNNIIGCVAVLQLASLYLDKNRQDQIWYQKWSISDSSFFIYCYHGIFATFLSTRIANSCVHSDLSAFFWSVIILIVLVAFGVILYNLLLRVAPRFLGLITGGRIHNNYS